MVKAHGPGQMCSDVAGLSSSRRIRMSANCRCTLTALDGSDTRGSLRRHTCERLIPSSARVTHQGPSFAAVLEPLDRIRTVVDVYSGFLVPAPCWPRTANVSPPLACSTGIRANHPGVGFTNSSVRINESSTTVTRTYTPKAGEITREWVVIDASDVVLGRLASHAATLLRGKHKPTFANHVDTGDFVIIINADKVALTGQKLEQKKAYRHSGYPGGLKAVTYSELLEKNPVRAVEKAVRGMLPKNSLGRQQLSKLKVYAGAEHPHAAQQPTTYTFDQVAQ